MFEPLPEDFAAALTASANRLGPYGRVLYLPEVESTNDVALSLASSGAAEGTSVLADTQRQGRGRRGHGWFSPAEAGLYLSVVVRPQAAAGVIPLLTIGAGVAMAAAVAEVSGLPVELKWPNDLMIGEPWRKLGGVLAEAVSSGGHFDAVVIGTGVNVRRASYPADLSRSVTSMEAELGRAVDRSALAVALLTQTRAVMETLHRGERESVAARWRHFAARCLGRAVQWHDVSGQRRGTVHDIDADGALLVGTERGVERIVAGAVTWESRSGV
jgi:BirA family biotin operon repressor/biotin-[acetyl-CoA-carboxylase] ligase